MGMPQSIVIGGVTYMLVPEEEYEDLMDAAYVTTNRRDKDKFLGNISEETAGGTPLHILCMCKYHGVKIVELTAKDGILQPSLPTWKTGDIEPPQS